MAHNAVDVNQKTFANRKYFHAPLEWNPETYCMVQRSRIKRAARIRFDGPASLDELEPFLIQFNAYATSPKTVKTPAARENYRKGALWHLGREFGIQIPDSVLKQIDDKTPLQIPTPAEVGAALNLTWNEREAGKLWTIRPDIDEDEFESLRREKARLKQERYRRRSGQQSRAEYLAAVASKNPEPWKAFGISKATYYRRKKAGTLSETRFVTEQYLYVSSRTQSHTVNPSSNSKNHIATMKPSEAQANGRPLWQECRPHRTARPAQGRLAPIHNDGAEVHAETVTSNPLHHRNPYQPISPAQESIVVGLNSRENRQPAAAPTDDNEAAILAEAKRILANSQLANWQHKQAETQKVAA